MLLSVTALAAVLVAPAAVAAPQTVRAAPAAQAAPVGQAEGALLAPARPARGRPRLGPNVKVFDPSMPLSRIQGAVDAVRDQQVDNEMGAERWALLFKPGTYGTTANPLIIQVGYYTEVAGLGRNPTDVTINGHVDVYNRCRPETGCFALDSFWRSLSNLTINVTGLDGCRSGTNFWAASQASPVRRVNITGGNLSLMDYCTDGPQFASGGFIADSKTGDVINGSQQQYLVRDSSIGSWSNGVWNQVFAGVRGAPAQSYPDPPYTTLARNPASREKPYLFISSAGTWKVFVPAPRTNYSGTTWENGPTLGRAIRLSKFFVAKPTDSVTTINSQLARGKNLLFTPGVYDVDTTIRITHADTVVLGLGIATLTAVDGATVMRTANVQGVDIAGIMIDAGEKNSPVLMQIGREKGHPRSNAANPTALQDVYFRIGGPHVGKAALSLEVNSDHVILDDIWAWRADHGNPGSFGWDVSPGTNGVIINGDNVTATGLFVEHYQEYNLIWRGERGRVVFFQNELPYDAPNQAAWQHDGVEGWAGYKVANSVTKHQLWGGGSYIFTNVDPTIHASRGFEVPRHPGVRLHDLVTVQLGAGTLDHVVNRKGLAVTAAEVGSPSCVVSYPSSDATPPTVAVTDDVAGATATGEVTFTLTFSEDVCSFTAEDIVVTGGSKGAFTRIDSRTATLVVSPTESSTGTVGVSLAEKSFADLLGNANKASSSAQQDFDTTPTAPTAPGRITFDESPPPTLTGFGGAADSTIAADPIDATNKVAQVLKAAGAEFYAGTTVSTLPNQAIDPIDFGATRTAITARVRSPDAGIQVRLKVESSTNGAQSVETEATTTLSGGWETLSFDFADQVPGTPALDPSLTYDKVSIFFDFGTVGTGKTYYVDDLDFTFGAQPAP